MSHSSRLSLCLHPERFVPVLGAILAHFFTDGMGRRYTFVVAAVGFVIGICIMVAAASYEFLLLGRAFVGLGVGIGLAVRSGCHHQRGKIRKKDLPFSGSLFLASLSL
jgi:MFS family permease